MRLLLFDIDGTLLHSGGAGRRALARALESVFGPTALERWPLAGKTDRQICREVLRAAGWDEQAIERGLPEALARYPALLEDELARGEPHTLPGVPALLARLRADSRYALGLLTGNVRAGAQRKLAAVGIAADAFCAGGAFGCDAEDRNALPAIALRRAERAVGRRFAPHETIVIGDTPRDVACGRHAGTRTLAVATGPHDAAALTAAGADRVLPDLARTDAVLATLEALAG
ncbi:MAG: HAD family hydrolase [Planctomycetota bacterium]|nr:MAG: HAD family hydrolase [Planctomycetota bacterium]